MVGRFLHARPGWTDSIFHRLLLRYLRPRASPGPRESGRRDSRFGLGQPCFGDAPRHQCSSRISRVLQHFRFLRLELGWSLASGRFRHLLSAAAALAGRGKIASESRHLVGASSNSRRGIPDHCDSAQSTRAMADDWLAYRRDNFALVLPADQIATPAWVSSNLPVTRSVCITGGEPAGLDDALAERTFCN